MKRYTLEEAMLDIMADHADSQLKSARGGIMPKFKAPARALHRLLCHRDAEARWDETHTGLEIYSEMHGGWVPFLKIGGR